MGLTTEQRKRYARQIALSEIGEEGQRKLLDSAVAVIGLGGLGSPAVLYLAAAGVGRLILVDPDVVDPGNLQRQVLYSTTDVGSKKVCSARETVAELNPDVSVSVYDTALDSENAADILAGNDFVVDATDDPQIKLLIARTCADLNIPYSYGGITGFTGQTMTVIPGKTTCLGCIFEETEPTSGSQAGPLGVIPGVIGTLQAGEAVKRIAGKGKLLTDRLLVFDAMQSGFREVNVSRSPTCSMCSNLNQ